MRKPPGLVIVVDPNKEHIAVAEANKLGIPVMALVDTNCDPDPVDHVIACNDDALKSVRLIITALAQTIIDEKNAQNVASHKEEHNDSEFDFQENEPITLKATDDSKEQVIVSEAGLSLEKVSETNEKPSSEKNKQS